MAQPRVHAMNVLYAMYDLYKYTQLSYLLSVNRDIPVTSPLLPRYIYTPILEGCRTFGYPNQYTHSAIYLMKLAAQARPLN